MSRPTPRMRLGVLGIVAVCLLGALFARLWFLQVLAAPEFQVAAEDNRVRVVAAEAPRGRTLDRTGEVIVGNRDSITITVDRQELADADNPEGVLRGLASAITEGRRRGDPNAAEVTVAGLREMLEDPRYSRFQPVPVAEDVTEQLEVFLSERHGDFPGVEVGRQAVRAYPYGTIAAHLLGYVGPVIDEDLEERAESPKPYQLGDEIGKSGVELAYEEHLRGTPGTQRIEVDADNEPVRVLSETPPIPGDDVWLTVDVDLQAVAEANLAQQLEEVRGDDLNNGTTATAQAGSVVVLDPTGGGVLAMASFPTYDPAQFINGISTARFAELNDPESDFPLNNRVIQGQYPAGSTFKPIVAYSALTQGLRTPAQTIQDEGVLYVGPADFTNAGGTAYGTVNLEKSLRVSSDVYYYLIGEAFWNERERYGEEALQSGPRAFGFGEQTGIPLPSEQDGLIPTPDSRAQRHEENPEAFPDGEWFTGTNVITSIGQGDVLVTPLQLANAYATFANGGTQHAPNIALKVTAHDSDEVVRTFEPRVTGQVELPAEIRQPMLDGLIGATTGERGTATTAFDGFPHAFWPVAGKTGTAQVNDKADNALFAGFGPANDPQYVAVAVLEQAGFGGNVAAPLVRSILEPVATGTLPPANPGGIVVPDEVAEPEILQGAVE